MPPQEHDPRRSLETAVLETVLYSDLFDYPLTRQELSHYLIGARADAELIAACLDAPRYLNGHVRQIGEYIVARRRERLVETRRARQATSFRLWTRARRYARILAALPYVRMVAITGSLAMDNSGPAGDIDLMIVTTRGRVWLARAEAIALHYAARLVRDALCPNYFVSEDALALEARDIYAAHEFAQMVPLFWLAVHQRMRQANEWVYAHLPNARTPLRAEAEIRIGRLARAAKRIGEWLLGGRLGDALERWEMQRKQRKFAPQITAASSAMLDRDHMKGHFVDYGPPIRRRFAEQLAEFMVDEGPRAA